MAATVRIRDVQTGHRREIPAPTDVLRVPWDLSNVTGPCVVEDGLVRYSDKTGEHSARSKPDRREACHPGDTVRVQYDEPRTAHPRVWGLCEIEAGDGHDSPED